MNIHPSPTHAEWRAFWDKMPQALKRIDRLNTLQVYFSLENPEALYYLEPLAMCFDRQPKELHLVQWEVNGQARV
jgi:hypothetical protein